VKYSNEVKKAFISYFFEGITLKNQLSTETINSIELTAKAIGITENQANEILQEINDTSNNIETVNINSFANVSGIADVDFIKYLRGAFDFDLSDYINENGNIVFEDIVKDKAGKFIKSYKIDAKGGISITFVDKFEVMNEINKIKERSRLNNANDKQEIKMIDFFKDKEFDFEQLQKDLDELKFNQ
jgi:hypothetical protein